MKANRHFLLKLLECDRRNCRCCSADPEARHAAVNEQVIVLRRDPQARNDFDWLYQPARPQP